MEEKNENILLYFLIVSAISLLLYFTIAGFIQSFDQIQAAPDILYTLENEEYSNNLIY